MLQKQANEGIRRGPPPGGVWHNLSSLGTYFTWEGDTYDHISRGDKQMEVCLDNSEFSIDFHGWVCTNEV